MASTSKLFGVLELLSSIIDCCTVDSRRIIAQTNRFHYNFIQDGYRRRIERELMTWFTRPEMIAFWSCLDESEGVIGGSVAINAVISIDNILDLDIFVPKGKEKIWGCFLLSLGWGLFFSNAHFSHRQEKFTTQWWKHPNLVGPFLFLWFTFRINFPYLVQSAPLRLTISTSPTSILPIIFSASHTAEMTFLTSSHLYSVYPDLTQNRQSVLIHTPNSCVVRPIDLKCSVYDWDQPCGVVCPSLERSWFRNREIGCVVWNNGSVDSERVRSLENQAYFWKIGGECDNPLCNAFVRQCN